MKTVYLIILLALVGWKGYHAWLRGRKSWTQDMQQYQSLWEYLLANGATLQEARKPFIKRALLRARLMKGLRASCNVAPLPSRYSHNDWYCCMSCVHDLRPRSQA